MRPLDQIHDVEELRDVARVALSSVDALQRELAVLKKRLGALEHAEAAQLLASIAKLEEKLHHYSQPGGKSEKRGSGKSSSRTPQTGHGPREQPALPTVEEVHKLDDADRPCPSCGNHLPEWEGQFEESEMIDVVVRQHTRKIIKRQKYRCSCGHIDTALGPKKLVESGRYSTQFAIQVVEEKFLDHVPLERQVRRLAREGLNVESQTLWDQEWALYTWLKPLEARMVEYQAQQRVRHGDETRWPVWGQETKNWMMWCDVSAHLAIYRILDGRSKEEGRQLFSNVRGTLMVDGYGVYTALAKQYPNLKLAHCWAHARRKFIEIEVAFPVESGRFVAIIGELFANESDGPQEELAQRRAGKSREIVSRLQQLMFETAALPGSGLRDAIDYVAKRWTGLTRFLDEPDVPLDNNLAERSLRGPVVGRKNHYGSKSRRGTEAAAFFYSVFESAKLVGLNPVHYIQQAIAAALDGTVIPLPHELVAKS